MNEQIARRMQNITPFYVMELLQKARKLESQGRDIVHMEIGEPDFATPDPVIRASVEILQQGQIKYTPAAGMPELREKIAQYYQRQYAVDVDPQRIFITPGASGAFLLTLGVSLNPGDEVLMTDPCYPCNSNFISFFDAVTRMIPVDAGTDFQLNAQLLEQHWGKRTRGVLITSPANPTGSIIAAKDLQQCVELVNGREGCLYSDEIYHGLVHGSAAASALQFSDRVFVINSFSKYFAMTGWRIGWLIVPEAYCDAVQRLAQNIFISTPSLSQHAALAAFSEENLEELENRAAEFARRGEFLYQELRRLGFAIASRPEGAFYIYADCSKFTADSYQFALDLLQQEGVAVTPGKDFGSNAPHRHIRFAYTTAMHRLEEGIRRLERFVGA